MTALFRVDFEVANNEDFHYAFALTDENGDPVDLAGATLRMDIESRAGGDVLSLSTENGRIAVEAAAGRFDLLVPAADMAALRENYHAHDLLMTLDGRTTRLWQGAFSIIQGVTE